MADFFNAIFDSEYGEQILEFLTAFFYKILSFWLRA